VGLPEPVIVGINASYTFTTGGWNQLGDGSERKYQAGGMPVTNWHTRLDSQNEGRVGAWLRDLGVRTTCTSDACR
jgi:hypothetical protein